MDPEPPSPTNEFFAPLQVGTALSGGCELTVLSARLTLDAEDRDLFSLDFRNAFNLVKRKVILDIWSRIFPEVLPFAEAKHNPPANVYGRSRLNCHISVEERVQEGDPSDLASSLAYRS